MKKILSLFIVAVLALSLTACGEKKISSQNYRTMYAGHYETLNYLVSQSAGDSEYFANMVDGLVEVNRFNQIIPSLADSWTVAMRDGKQVWTFKIKKGIKWHKNNDLEEYAEVTAHDWVTSAKYILNPKYNSATIGIVSMFIDGAKNYNCSLQAKNAEAEGKDAPSCTEDENYEFNTSFEQVGVKAVDDNTLEYTLNSPAPYFLTALTYNCFYPVSEDYLLETGDDFGTDSSFLLINGAYSMTTDEYDTTIELTANPKYWDKKNVYVETITYKYAGGDIGHEFYRLKYEAGEIDGFKLNEEDNEGWKQYVEGECTEKEVDGETVKECEGTLENPVEPTAYSRSRISPYTYYHSWNYKRVNFDGSDLTEDQHKAANMAVNTPEFRVGFIHGFHRPTFTSQWVPDNPLQWVRNTYTPRELALDQNGRDYVDYVIDVIAEKTGEDRDEVAVKYADGSDAHYNVEKALGFFKAAKEKLIAAGLTEDDFPIQIEGIASSNGTRVPHYQAVYDKFNAEFGEYFELKLMIPSNPDEFKAWSTSGARSYDILMFMGWGPDYSDPRTYLNTYAINGDMLKYSNLHGDNELQAAVLGEFDEIYREAIEITDEDKIDKRFEKFAEAEYKLVYELGIVSPFMSPRGQEVRVSRIKPHTLATVNFGLAKMKYKGMIVLEEALTKEQRDELKAEYEAELEKQ